MHRQWTKVFYSFSASGLSPGGKTKTTRRKRRRFTLKKWRRDERCSKLKRVLHAGLGFISHLLILEICFARHVIGMSDSHFSTRVDVLLSKNSREEKRKDCSALIISSFFIRAAENNCLKVQFDVLSGESGDVHPSMLCSFSSSILSMTTTLSRCRGIIVIHLNFSVSAVRCSSSCLLSYIFPSLAPSVFLTIKEITRACCFVMRSLSFYFSF